MENHVFPYEIDFNRSIHISLGLTKRELFAAMAMQGMAAGGECTGHYDPLPIARAAIEYADALLAELEKGEKP